MTIKELLEKMDGVALVIDPVTDARETAVSCEVRPLAAQERHNAEPMASGGAALALRTLMITDRRLIRALYDHPTAAAYGDGSYTVHTT
jgi:hypothetical protein